MTEYEINWTCDWLEDVTKGSMFTDEFRERLRLVTNSARKYEKIKEALKCD